MWYYNFSTNDWSILSGTPGRTDSNYDENYLGAVNGGCLFNVPGYNLIVLFGGNGKNNLWYFHTVYRNWTFIGGDRDQMLPTNLTTPCPYGNDRGKAVSNGTHFFFVGGSQGGGGGLMNDIWCYEFDPEVLEYYTIPIEETADQVDSTENDDNTNSDPQVDNTENDEYATSNPQVDNTENDGNTPSDQDINRIRTPTFNYRMRNYSFILSEYIEGSYSERSENILI